MYLPAGSKNCKSRAERYYNKVYIKKKKGPSTEPCTPMISRCDCDTYSLQETLELTEQIFQ